MKFILSNRSQEALLVERHHFFIQAEGTMALSNSKLGREHGDPARIPPGQALASATWHAEFYYVPEFFGFFNGDILIRYPISIPNSIRRDIVDFRRTETGWPGDDALVKYPVRTAFSTQMIPAPSESGMTSTTATASAPSGPPPAATPPPPRPTPQPKPEPVAPPPSPSGVEQVRYWTHLASGRRVQAKLMAVSTQTVTLNRPSDGRKMRVPISELSEADQAYVNARR